MAKTQRSRIADDFDSVRALAQMHSNGASIRSQTFGFPSLTSLRIREPFWCIFSSGALSEACLRQKLLSESNSRG